METNWYIRKEFATIQSSKLWLSISCRNKSFGKKSLMGINLTDGCTLKLILIISMLEKLLSFRINFQNLTHLQFTGKDKVWLSSWRKYKDSTSDNLGHMIYPLGDVWTKKLCIPLKGVLKQSHLVHSMVTCFIIVSLGQIRVLYQDL